MQNKVAHLLWTIVILVLAIVAMVVAKPNSSFLFSYVSFAAAISSILLAVITIIFTMISNRGFDATLSEIRTSASKVADETSRLGMATQGLSKEADDAIRRLSTLPTELTRMSGKLEKKIESAMFSEGRNDISDQGPDKVKAGGKPVGVVAGLYLIHLADKTSKSVVARDIFSESKYMEDYIIGFLDSFKYFNKCGTIIEKAAASFSVEELGNLDLAELAQSVEDQEDLTSDIVQIFDEIRGYFGLSGLPLYQEIDSDAEIETENETDS